MQLLLPAVRAVICPYLVPTSVSMLGELRACSGRAHPVVALYDSGPVTSVGASARNLRTENPTIGILDGQQKTKDTDFRACKNIE